MYIIGHVPVGYLPYARNTTAIREYYNERLVKIFRKYSSIIAGQFFGHTHRDSIMVLLDEEGNDACWLLNFSFLIKSKSILSCMLFLVSLCYLSLKKVKTGKILLFTPTPTLQEFKSHTLQFPKRTLKGWLSFSVGVSRDSLSFLFFFLMNPYV